MGWQILHPMDADGPYLYHSCKGLRGPRMRCKTGVMYVPEKPIIKI